MNTGKDARTALSRADAERLLSRRAPEGEGLEQLCLAMEALGRLAESVPVEDDVQRFAAQAARSVPVEGRRPARFGAAAGGTAGAARARRRRLRPALAATAAAVVVVMSASAGVAYAADGAVPGDTLYGVDLALEKVGIGDGGLKERLTEASQLVARGRTQDGLDLAGNAISKSATGDRAMLMVAESLRVAAQAAAKNQGARTPEELKQIAEKLRLMASGEKSAEELGRAVEDLAGSLQSKDGSGGAGGSGGTGNDAGQGQGDSSGGGGTDGGQGGTDPVPSGGAGGVGPGGSAQPR